MGSELKKKNKSRIIPYLNLKISLNIIKFLGTWPPLKKPLRVIYFFYTLITFIFMLGIYLTVQAANMYVVWGDVDKMVGTGFLLLTNSVHTYKIYIIIKHQNKIRHLLDTVESNEFSKDNDYYTEILTSYTWRSLIHHIVYQAFGTVAVSCWAITPIINTITGHARRLPMDAWYPYDTKKSPAYEATCAHQSLAVICCCIHNIGVDTLINGLINVACCQLEIIKMNIQRIDVHKSAIMDVNTANCHFDNDICMKLNNIIRHTNLVYQ